MHLVFGEQAGRDAVANQLWATTSRPRRTRRSRDDVHDLRLSPVAVEQHELSPRRRAPANSPGSVHSRISVSAESVSVPERAVLVALANRHRRQNRDRQMPWQQLQRALEDPSIDAGVDAERQVRSVLLDRTDRQDGDQCCASEPPKSVVAMSCQSRRGMLAIAVPIARTPGAAPIVGQRRPCHKQRTQATGDSPCCAGSTAQRSVRRSPTTATPSRCPPNARWLRFRPARHHAARRRARLVRGAGRACFANLLAILAEARMGAGDLVRLTYLTDAGDRAAYMAVRDRHVTSRLRRRPCWSCGRWRGRSLRSRSRRSPPKRLGRLDTRLRR